MPQLLDILIVVLHSLGIVLVTILIIISYRTLKIVNQIEAMIQDVDNKIKTLNGFFSALNKSSNFMKLLSDKIISFLEGIIQKIFKKKYNNNKEEEEDE
ncbi:MAG: hypothetical protein ACOXZR_02710 [Bacilli bacterium]|jgi:predicted PurR-regulated permease PerM